MTTEEQVPFEVGSTVEIFTKDGEGIDTGLIKNCHFVGEEAELPWVVELESLALHRKKQFLFAGDEMHGWRLVFEGAFGENCVNFKGPFYALHQRA